MIQLFLTVFQQVVILLVLIVLGYILGKTGVLDDRSVSGMTNMVLIFVTPCVIIKSFIRDYDPKTLKNILICFLATFAIHFVFIVGAHLIYRSPDEARRRVLRFAAVFSNCGFMSLPLQEAVLGEDGLLYGASFVAIFNLLVWSYGVAEISGDKKYISPKKLILNPGLLGVAIGFIIFIASIPIPKVLATPIGHMAALNTPLPMLIIGYHLSKSNLFAALKDPTSLFSVAVRLLLFPAAALAVVYLCGIRGNLFVSLAIACCAPTAAITTMFSAKFGKATDLSVNLVSLSTVLSMVTMPLIVTLAEMLA